MAQNALERVGSCLLAAGGPDGPAVAAARCWFDGANLWLRDAEGRLADCVRDARALAVWASPPAPGDPGMLVSGPVRAFGTHDPLGLLLHGPALAGVMAGWDIARAPGPLRAAFDWARGPFPGLVRVRARRVRFFDVTAAATEHEGVAPALPPAVPQQVRRALSGRRDAVAVTARGEEVEVTPVAWSTGFQVRDWGTAPAGQEALLVVHDDGSGVGVRGRVGSDGRFEPKRVEWWADSTTGVADMGPVPLALPD